MRIRFPTGFGESFGPQVQLKQERRRTRRQRAAVWSRAGAVRGNEQAQLLANREMNEVSAGARITQKKFQEKFPHVDENSKEHTTQSRAEQQAQRRDPKS